MLELTDTSSQEPVVLVSSQFHVQWLHAGSLKLARVEYLHHGNWQMLPFRAFHPASLHSLSWGAGVQTFISTPLTSTYSLWSKIPVFWDTLRIFLWIIICLGRWIWMPQKHYGDLCMKTTIDTCLNSIGLDNKPCALWVFLSSKGSGGFILIPSWCYNLPFFTERKH